nr:hypothetical protein [Tanacetum cinerariifolium]
MYHKKNVDFAYLLWEDFIYQVEHKDAKKRNEMYYPRFTKVIINFFMTKDPLIPRRNKVNWHYVRDDQMFTTIKLVSRHQNTQQFGAMLPDELINEDIRNSAAYKEYYAIASGAAPPKTKASVRKTQSSFDTTMPPPTATGTRLSTSAKGKQPAKSSKAKGLSMLSERRKHQSGRSRCSNDVHTTQVLEDTHVTLTSVNPDGQQQSSPVSSQFVTSMLNPSPDTGFLMNRLKIDTLTPELLVSPTYELMKGSCKSLVELEFFLEDVYKATTDQLNLNNPEGQQYPHNLLKPLPLIPNSQGFLMNRLKVDTLTPELLVSPTYELMKGSCKSLVELEFFLEDVYKATTDQLDLNNPEGQQYPHNLLKPLPLIPNSQGRRIIPFDHFINNELEYLHSGRRVIPFDHFINNDFECLRGGSSSRKYTTSVTKTKAADYGHVKWIKNLMPHTVWIQEPVGYGKHALWGISHWGRKRQQFYGFAVNRESTRDVYSKRRIIAVTEFKIVEWHNYKHLDWIMVRRDDEKLYKLKEGDFKRLCIQDLEDMLLLLVQGKLTNLTVEERFAFNISLRMFTRSFVIQRRVKDLQLGVESYQKKLNLRRPDIDGMLNDVRTALDDRLKGIRMKYLPQTIWRKSDKERAAAMIQIIGK